MADLPIVHVDRWIIVVDKPHGLRSQSPRHDGDHVVARLGATHPYVALHHRLDAAASGLLVLAVDRRANRGLAQAFAGHQVQRTYHAVLSGTSASAIWDRPVDGRSARTEVAVLGTGSGASAVRLTPTTGRKHQLRVHAAMAGTPICGDRRHGGEAAGRWPRLALHAARLALRHPVTHEDLSFTSPIPSDLARLWAEAGGEGGGPSPGREPGTPMPRH